MWSDLLIGSGYAGGAGAGGGGPQAWGQNGKQGDVLLLFSLSMFSRKFQEGQAMLLVKRINETKHREPFAMSKVVVSLVRLRVLVLLFFFFFLWWLIAKFKCHGKRTAATPLGFMFPQFSWYCSCYTRLSPSLSLSVIGPKTLARRAAGSLQRDIAVKIFQIVVTLVTSYGEYGEWEQVVSIVWSVLASEVPSGP